MLRGFLHPELLLGPTEVKPNRHQEIEEFLNNVARLRGIPLHVANLWNALYFGFDLGAGCYFPETIDPARIPQRQMREHGPYLPVGAFLRVVTRTQVGDLWSEVVFREGRHPDVGVFWTPPEISGAPASLVEVDGQRVAEVSEALVLDFEAFGRDKNHASEGQLERIRGKGKWLDKHGHFLVEAQYRPDEADLDDRTLYARYLMEHHRDGLLAYAMESDDDEDVWAMLLNSLSAVADIAAGSRQLIRWGDYFLERDAYEASASDDSIDFPMGIGDLRQIFNGVATNPRGSHATYSAVGPTINALLEGSGNRQIASLVRGVSYSKCVVVANAYILGRLAIDAPHGVLPGGQHLRLDDAWQSGGIWRSQAHAANKLISGVDPAIPLRLGYAESSGPRPVSGPDRLISTSPHGWRTTLNLTDLSRYEVRVSDSALAMLAGRQTVRVRLRHDNELVIDKVVGVNRDLRVLAGVEWPMAFFPGITVFSQVEHRSEVVTVRTERLTEPIVVDGDVLEFKCDPEVYARFKGIRDNEPLARRANQGTTLRDLVNAAFRRHGRPAAGGGVELTFEEIMAWVFGPDAGATEAGATMAALETMDVEQAGQSYLWRPRITRRTRATDHELLAAYGEEDRARLTRIVRRHLVRMHLRRSWASSLKEATYEKALIEHRYRGLLPPALPDGYTWVRAHERGGEVVALDVTEELLSAILVSDSGHEGE